MRGALLIRSVLFSLSLAVCLEMEAQGRGSGVPRPVPVSLSPTGGAGHFFILWLPSRLWLLDVWSVEQLPAASPGVCRRSGRLPQTPAPSTDIFSYS